MFRYDPILPPFFPFFHSKARSVRIVTHDVFAPISPVQEMVKRAGKFDTTLARHYP
jgi:hypothetical protein